MFTNNSRQWPVKQSTSKPILAEGIYKDELVIVIDQITGTNEYLINYNGPIWIKADQIVITKYYI